MSAFVLFESHNDSPYRKTRTFKFDTTEPKHATAALSFARSVSLSVLLAEHASSSEFKLEAESIEAALIARRLCEEFLGHGVYDSALEEAKVGLQS